MAYQSSLQTTAMSASPRQLQNLEGSTRISTLPPTTPAADIMMPALDAALNNLLAARAAVAAGVAEQSASREVLVAECATLQVQIMSLRDSFCVERAELEDLVKGLRAEQMRILAEKDAVEVQLKTALRKIQQSAEPPNSDSISTRLECAQCMHRSSVTVKSEPRVKIESEGNLDGGPRKRPHEDDVAVKVEEQLQKHRRLSPIKPIPATRKVEVVITRRPRSSASRTALNSNAPTEDRKPTAQLVAIPVHTSSTPSRSVPILMTQHHHIFDFASITPRPPPRPVTQYIHLFDFATLPPSQLPVD
ncbi:hypothetical protein B0H13DRAFT_889631 [Mycena leptocephala]|nr:hypothetical protein B0H13DRAFT_889631 [Mycena leptocephala]